MLRRLLLINEDEALPRIDMLRRLLINEDEAPLHIGQNTHMYESEDIQSNLFSTNYLECNVLNCGQLRLEVLIECLAADEVQDVYSLDEIREISNNFENYLHYDDIFDCMRTSLTNQFIYMYMLRAPPLISDSENESGEAASQSSDDSF